MEWIIILILSLPAVIMGSLSIKGYTQGKELVSWFSIGILCILYIYFFIPDHPFFHLFMIGLLWGVLNSTIQIIFYPSYLANNPKAAQSYKKVPKRINPRIIMLLIGIATGVATGFLFGSISWITKKVIFDQ